MEGLNPLEIEMHIKELLQDRQKTADDYWEREFEPLLGGNDL
jgi:hypothetical protein